MNSSNVAKSLEELNDEKINELTGPIIYLFITLIIGIPGNCIVMLIFGRKYHKSVYRSIVLNLAVADFIFCTIGIPFNIARVFNYYTFDGRWVCKIFKTLLIFGMIYSTQLLMLLSIHRFRKIYMPLKKQISLDNIHYSLIGCFVVAVFFTWPQIIVIDIEQVSLENNITGRVCAITPADPSPYLVAYSSTLLGMFGFCTVVLLVTYLLIGRKLYLIKKKTHRKEDLDAQRHISGKMTKIAFTVSVVFGISYLPWIILKVSTDWIDHKELNTFEFSILRIFERFYIINHVANPFIYAIFDNSFRKHVRGFVPLTNTVKQSKTVRTSSTATS